MPFEANIKIDGGTPRRVLHSSYSLSQSSDFVTGKTTSEVYAVQLNLEVESIKDSEFFKLMIHPTKRCKGEIVFKSPDDIDKDFKKIEFEEGGVVGYSESMDARSSGTMTENIVIACKKFTVDGVSIEKKW
jgi:Hemolysin coregulated protein Hcp (TssD)